MMYELKNSLRVIVVFIRSEYYNILIRKSLNYK